MSIIKQKGENILKKFVIIAYIMLILIIFISGFFVYKVIAQNKNNDQNEGRNKALANVEFFEHEIVNFFNEINNIKFENYTISATDIEKKSSKTESTDALKSDSGNGEKQGSSESSKSDSKEENSGEQSKTPDSSSESSSQGQTSDKAQNESSNNQQYKMEKSGVLTNKDKTNWNQIKSEVERVYALLNLVTTDLYQTQTSKEEIQIFNNEFDNFTKSINNENKEESLKELSLLYEYMPEFFENCTENENKITVIKTKNDIFKAYSILDSQNWDKMQNYVEEASKNFENLMQIANSEESKAQNIIEKYNTNKNGVNKYDINKANIMIDELKNAINMKDKDIFLIKYKNLLEELENI